MNEHKFLLIKGRSGLASRMLCVLTGILYARLTRRRLLVDWTDPIYSDDGSNTFHRFFQCPLTSPTDSIPITESVYPGIWRGRLHASAEEMETRYGTGHAPDRWRQFSVDLTRLDHQEDVLVLWTFGEEVELLSRYFQGAFADLGDASKEAILRRLLREDLVLHPQIRQQVERFRSDCFRGPMVGVHVRYSDRRADLWGILEKLRLLSEQERELQLFLATDNIEVKKLLEENYPRVITTPHWYPAAGHRLHGNEACPDRVQDGIDALVDLYLLAECEYLVMDSSSSFSRLANLLREGPQSKVLSVRGPKWDRRALLQWRLWVKLGVFTWGFKILRRWLRIRRLYRQRQRS